MASKKHLRQKGLKPMNKGLFAVVLGIALVGCSSPPKKNYDVTTIQSVSYSLLELADHKRQLGEYDKALALYLDAERYATMRNDKYVVGISKLKRAGILIKTDKVSQAETLIGQVSQMEQYEQVGLSNAIKYLQAQLAHKTEDNQTAITLLSELSAEYLEDAEKTVYYNTVRWVYGDVNVPLSRVKKGLETLEELKNQSKLNNIEILSYTLYQLTKGLSATGELSEESTILKAIEHFSSLEMSNKISESYQFAATFYQRNGQQQKADYYQQQAENIAALNMK